MIEDPKVKAIIDRGTGQFLTRKDKFYRFLMWALVVGFVALSGGTWGVHALASRANVASQKASVSIQSQCLFFYGVGQSSGPTVPPNISKVGLSILVGARAAYEGLDCKLGALPTPAPEVAAQLPPGVT